MQKWQQIAIKTNVKHCDYVVTMVADSGDSGSNLACSLWSRVVVLDALSTEQVLFCMWCLLWLAVRAWPPVLSRPNFSSDFMFTESLSPRHVRVHICVKIRSPPQVVLGRVLSTLFFWDKNSPWLRIDLFNWTSCLQSPRESGSCPCPSPSAVMTGLHHGSGNGLTLGAHPCLQAPCPLSSLSTHVSFLSNLILRNFPSKTYIPPHYCSCKRICVFRF